ncbi:MAG: hypothetical protein IPN69_08325 [Acidobacteria bacterium]|nr:hypothetical protein [Acidobacteriota bacterium]
MAYDFRNSSLIGKADLFAWHPADTAVSGALVSDASGNGRDLVCGSNAPALQADVLNGRSAIYFNGSTNEPLVYSHGSTVSPRHFFIVAKFDGATFSANLEGLLSDGASNGLLIGQGATETKFYNFSHGGSYIYKKADLAYAESNQAAPMNAFAVIELQFPAGIAMDGIQIGRDRGFSGRKWKGWFLESLVYSTSQNDNVRANIYRYFAQKWQLWQIDSAGRYIFPFAADRTRTEERGQESYLSEPYDGDPKALVRGDFKSNFACSFSVREEAEMLAVHSFYEQHFPLTKFVYRDWRYYPARDRIVRFATTVTEQGSEVSNRFNYAFGVREV